MFNILRLLIIFFGAYVSLFASAEEADTASAKKATTIVVAAPIESPFVQMLKLALDKTVTTHGEYQLQDVRVVLTDNRLKAAVRSGHIDVIWSPTNPEFENTLLPVRISLLKELDDYRILIIRAGDQHRFDAIRTLDDLRKFTGGIGAHWTDADIMRANDLPIVSAVDYMGLFRMLAAGRFDYFSRGIYQVRFELSMLPESGLAMEQGLMLHYPSENYFFVNRTNVALAERIRQGLELAIADGSFDQLLYAPLHHQWARAEIMKNKRRVLRLNTEISVPYKQFLKD